MVKVTLITGVGRVGMRPKLHGVGLLEFKNVIINRLDPYAFQG